MLQRSSFGTFEHSAIFYYTKKQTNKKKKRSPTNKSSSTLIYIWDTVDVLSRRSALMIWWYVAENALSTRGPWTPETVLQATKGLSAGTYITRYYLSGAGVHHHELWTLGTVTSKRRDSQQRAAFSSTKHEHSALRLREYETVLDLLEVCVVPQRRVESAELCQVW